MSRHQTKPDTPQPPAQEPPAENPMAAAIDLFAAAEELAPQLHARAHPATEIVTVWADGRQTETRITFVYRFPRPRRKREPKT